jgi:arylsulfatase A-like enzyme
MIENMDYNIGRLIQFLKDTDQYDNTLIMFTSDNGGSEPSDSP